ncbi:MAG TPA: DUF72 domain-containing protein [Egibacteraceae bacterium]|nr:DUF72 domain-containing protein [Egibacteraceae bacterium]
MTLGAVLIWIGTSGWQYRDWRGAFFPEDLAQREWLPHYAERFETVEVNSTFYRLPERETFAGWAQATPADFVVTVKASRYLSHIRRLRDAAQPIARLLDRAGGLGKKLGPVLVQLPPDFEIDLERLSRALGKFPTHIRVAVELRHASWFVDDTRRLLADHGAALCLADRGSAWITPQWRTADWGYVRFHAGAAAPHPCYGRTALEARAATIAGLFELDADVYAYFNNDGRCCAVRDAHRFALACRRRGLQPTRTPGAREVSLAH